MSIVKNMLVEERNRLEKLLKKYLKNLKRFPKGSISIKTINNIKYIYLAFREDKKVHFKYIGRKDSDKAKEIKKDIQERRELEKRIKQVKESLKEVKKALNGI